MEHHASWWDVLMTWLWGNFSHNLEALKNAMGWPANEEGKTWLEGADVGLTHVLGWLVVLILVVLVAFVARSKVSDEKEALVPEDKLTLRTFVELLTEATYGQMASMMGTKAAKFFLPLIGTCAFMILFSNAIGLVPGFAPPTDNLNTTLGCAMIIFFATHVFGVKEHGVAYFKHFLGPLWWLAPLMLVIEIISHLARPASLAIRLMANMTADHLVLTIFLGLIPFVVPVPMYLLGTIVVIVQTLVFCLLSTVYIAMAIEHAEEH